MSEPSSSMSSGREVVFRGGAAVALAMVLGCADRPPTAQVPPAAVATTPAAATVLPRAIAARPVSPSTPRTRLPPPIAMPGGGVRIDMRGSTKHVRALERQPDGTYKHVCVDAPEVNRIGGSR